MATLPIDVEKIIERFGPHKGYPPSDGFPGAHEPDKLVKTHCCFCGMQCGMQLKVKDNAIVGFEPWMDRKKLMPGQNWPRAIERAIDVSSYFIACLSRESVCKRGQFQAELRYALQCARKMPLGEIFFIPVRLNDCAVPAEIAIIPSAAPTLAHRIANARITVTSSRTRGPLGCRSGPRSRRGEPGRCS